MFKRYSVMCSGLILAVAALAVFTSPAQVSAQATSLKIGLVTDVGHVDDRGFNQSTWEGVQAAAKELNLPAEYIETNDATDYATNINALLDKGDNVIVTVGFNIADAATKAAQANPKVVFIGVDQFQGTVLPNSTGIVFPEDQSGFLAGVLAARMSKSGKIAGVYGTDQVPPVVRFKEGYESGAKYANPNIVVISTFYPGDISKAFSDPSWGATTAGQALDQGADVVFGAGGGTGNGALQEVAKRTTKDKPLYCIGVDTDQWGTLPEAQPCLISSAEKLIPPAIDTLMKQAVAGTIKGGNFTGTVALAPFHDFSTVVPTAVQTELSDLAAKLASGALTSKGVPGTPSATMAATMSMSSATMAATMAETMAATPAK